MNFLCYPGCSTCKKAEKWLIEHEFSFEKRNIAQDNPSYDELLQWWKQSKMPLKKFFNTSGNVYKELNLKEKLPQMTEEEQLTLLSSNGMLVRRPILCAGERLLVGFKEEEWSNALL